MQPAKTFWLQNNALPLTRAMLAQIDALGGEEP
jgi:hypothetical protein